MPYMIGLAARTFDPEGTLLLPWREGTQTESLSRRVSRVRTLDGGVAVSDRGHSPGDRTIVVSLEGMPRATIDRARRLLRLHSNVTLSLRDGAYLARTSGYDESRQTLTVLITGTA